MGVWVWRAIGLAVVAVAVVIALWFMGQVGNAIGGVNLTPPTATASASPTILLPGPSASPTGPAPSASSSAPAKRSPSPSPKH